MPRYERVQPLFELLCNARRPQTMSELCEKLGVSRATINRLIAFLRDALGQDIRYDRDRNGYWIKHDSKVSGTANLLGLTSTEAASLLEAISVLEQIPPGLIRSNTSVIRSGLQRLCQEYLGNGGLSGRVQLRASHPRKANAKSFGILLDALRKEVRVEFLYRNRGKDDQGARTVSPIRMVLYRSNWYLAAWCHERDGLRVFSLDRVLGVKPLTARAYKPLAKLVDQELESSYGIFTGVASNTAVLLFDAKVAPWVAEEQWHPDAKAEFLTDGRVRLTIPYRVDTELVMEILRYGDSCLVQSPMSLRKNVAQKLMQAAERYKETG